MSDNGDPGSPDPGSPDPGAVTWDGTDPGTTDFDWSDIGISDPGMPDVGIPDLGIPDLGLSDVDMPDSDFEMPDLGTPDLGLFDIGVSDIGLPDGAEAGPHGPAIGGDDDPYCPPDTWSPDADSQEPPGSDDALYSWNHTNLDQDPPDFPGKGRRDHHNPSGGGGGGGGGGGRGGGSPDRDDAPSESAPDDAESDTQDTAPADQATAQSPEPDPPAGPPGTVASEPSDDESSQPIIAFAVGESHVTVVATAGPPADLSGYHGYAGDAGFDSAPTGFGYGGHWFRPSSDGTGSDLYVNGHKVASIDWSPEQLREWERVFGHDPVRCGFTTMEGQERGLQDGNVLSVVVRVPEGVHVTFDDNVDWVAGSVWNLPPYHAATPAHHHVAPKAERAERVERAPKTEAAGTASHDRVYVIPESGQAGDLADNPFLAPFLTPQASAPFDANGALDPAVFPPAAAYTPEDLRHIDATSPERVAGHMAYETVTGVMGVNTASAPQTAGIAERDRMHDPGVTPAEQATAIAMAIVPVEKLLGLGIQAVVDSATAAELRTFLRTLAHDTTGGLRIPGTRLPPLRAGEQALIRVAASDGPVVLRDLSVSEVEALVDRYGSGLAQALHDRGTIASYDALSTAVSGIGHQYNAHHIVEQKVLRLIDLPTDQAPSVILTVQEHAAISAALARELPPTEVEHMTRAQIRQGYERAYRDHPEWIAEVRRYFPK